MTEQELKRIIESVLFAADEPVSLKQIQGVFAEDNAPETDAIKSAIAALQEDYADHSLELREVGSGYRFQVKQDYANWVSKLWEEKPARYSRATLETLALIAYRQPITRGEIEEIRGVSVSSQIIKTLQEREWVKVVGHRDVPGKPALYATTHEFLDYFNLKSLQDLPPLSELRDIDSINAELDWGEGEQTSQEQTQGESDNPQQPEQDIASTDSESEQASEEAEDGQDATADTEAREGDSDEQAVAGEEQNNEEESERTEQVVSAEH